MIDVIWIIAGFIVFFALAIFWRRRSAVWGGLTIGIIIGLLVATYFAFKGSSFDWYLVAKIVVVTTLVGLGAELLGKISDYFHSKKKVDDHHSS